MPKRRWIPVYWTRSALLQNDAASKLDKITSASATIKRDYSECHPFIDWLASFQPRQDFQDVPQHGQLGHPTALVLMRLAPFHAYFCTHYLRYSRDDITVITNTFYRKYVIQEHYACRQIPWGIKIALRKVIWYKRESGYPGEQHDQDCWDQSCLPPNLCYLSACTVLSK